MRQFFARNDERIAALFLGAEKIEKEPFADAEGRHDDPRRAHRLDDLIEHSGAVGEERAAIARHHLHRVYRVDIPAEKHAAKLRCLAGLDFVVMHDMEGVALLAHVEPGQRPPGAADRVEWPACAFPQNLRGPERL